MKKLIVLMSIFAATAAMSQSQNISGGGDPYVIAINTMGGGDPYVVSLEKDGGGDPYVSSVSDGGGSPYQIAVNN